MCIYIYIYIYIYMFLAGTARGRLWTVQSLWRRWRYTATCGQRVKENCCPFQTQSSLSPMPALWGWILCLAKQGLKLGAFSGMLAHGLRHETDTESEPPSIRMLPDLEGVRVLDSYNSHISHNSYNSYNSCLITIVAIIAMIAIIDMTETPPWNGFDCARCIQLSNSNN